MPDSARRVVIEQTGGAEVLALREEPLSPPGPGEVQVEHGAIGVNFIDIYHRSGLYPVPLPSGLGLEAAGRVTRVGDDVEGLAPGDRVATFGPALGAYATARNLPAAHLLAVPDSIDDRMAAASLLKGCTAEFLVERCARVEEGWPVLVHAAAGGVGLLLVQWLKHLGAHVIGTVSTEEKAELARDAGAEEVLLTSEGDIAERVRRWSGGDGVRVVFDGVGQSTWQASLASLARRGLLISFGNASGPVRGIDLVSLGAQGSVFVTRPVLFDYYADPAERAAGAARFFDMLDRGRLEPTIGQTYPLVEAAQAHRDLEARKTHGASLLLP